ncbi:hypothetical protein J3E68DRAFT_405350 [Trichoderma sp. SZMC 28012]
MLCYLLLLYSSVLLAKFCLVGMARAYWDYQTSARLHTHTSSLIASLPLFSPAYRHPTGGSHSAVLQQRPRQMRHASSSPLSLFPHLLTFTGASPLFRSRAWRV